LFEERNNLPALFDLERNFDIASTFIADETENLPHERLVACFNRTGSRSPDTDTDTPGLLPQCFPAISWKASLL